MEVLRVKFILDHCMLLLFYYIVVIVGHYRLLLFKFFFLSSFQTNQFTGMVYQTVLLPHRHSLKTGSLDEAITPNTSPAQWPGINNLYMCECFS